MDSVDLNYVLSLSSIESICRVCLLEEGSISLLVTAVQNMVEINIQEVFEVYAGTQVQENDKLPQHICRKCFRRLLKTNEFIMKCKRSNSILEEIKSVWDHTPSLDKFSGLNNVYKSIEKNVTDNITECNRTDREINKNMDRLEISTEISDTTASIQNISKTTDCDRASVCPKVSECKNDSKSHKPFRSKEEKLFNCRTCSTNFTNLSNLKRHIKSHSGERPYSCDVCCRAFSRFESLKDHINIHTGIKPYLCDICNRTFYRMSSLKIHLTKHKGLPNKSTKVTCSVCNSVLASKATLCNHMLVHAQKFLCNLCGMKFAQKGSFLHHYRSHTGERPFGCDECPKKFSYKQGLKMHKLVHTGDKPYSCSICAKAFTQLNNLKRHMRYHAGTKPYSCKYCVKKFVEKRNLTVHMRIHTGETPYICTVCNEGFYESGSLKKHKRIHNENSNTRSTKGSTE